MDLDDFIVTPSCLIDETIPTVLAGRRLRQRGPAPILADSEVLTMEVGGEFLGDDQVQAIFQHVRRYDVHFFPALGRVHRTTFVRQAANLWALKDQLWHHLVARERTLPNSQKFPSGVSAGEHWTSTESSPLERLASMSSQADEGPWLTAEI